VEVYLLLTIIGLMYAEWQKFAASAGQQSYTIWSRMDHYLILCGCAIVLVRTGCAQTGWTCVGSGCPATGSVAAAAATAASAVSAGAAGSAGGSRFDMQTIYEVSLALTAPVRESRCREPLDLESRWI
jgi:hypothetical protein